MMRQLNFAVVSLILSGGMAFAADNVPKLNVSKTCRHAYGALNAPTSTGAKKASQAEIQQAYKSCMDSENAAQKSAAARWTRVKGENRRTCASMAGALFPSYVELDACLQMYDDKDPQLSGGTPAATTLPARKR